MLVNDDLVPTTGWIQIVVSQDVAGARGVGADLGLEERGEHELQVAVDAVLKIGEGGAQLAARAVKSFQALAGGLGSVTEAGEVGGVEAGGLAEAVHVDAVGLVLAQLVGGRLEAGSRAPCSPRIFSSCCQPTWLVASVPRQHGVPSA